MRKRLLIGAVGLILVTLFASTAVSYQTGWRIWEQHAVETSNQVAYGGFENAVGVHKFGRNADVGTTTETIWNVGGLYVWPVTAETVTIVSTSANDDGNPVGTGAQTLRVIGLDVNYIPLQEDITLEGLTPVITTGEFLRVFRAYVLASGVVGSNDGSIQGAQTTSGFNLFDIETGTGQTVLGHYTVGIGQRFLVTRVFGSIGRQVAAAAIVELRFRPVGESWRSVVYLGMNSQGSTLANIPYLLPLTFEQGTDIELRSSASLASSDINAGFDGYLITVQ